MDIVFLGAAALMFVAIAGMVVGCDKLGAPNDLALCVGRCGLGGAARLSGRRLAEGGGLLDERPRPGCCSSPTWPCCWCWRGRWHAGWPRWPKAAAGCGASARARPVPAGGRRRRRRHGLAAVCAGAAAASTSLGVLVVYALQRLQARAAAQPAGHGRGQRRTRRSTPPSASSPTPTGRATAAKSTMSYLTQMLALAVQNFLSAATGIVVVVALIRGFARAVGAGASATSGST